MHALHARTASDTPTAERELARALELEPEAERILLAKLDWLMGSKEEAAWNEAGQIAERLSKVATHSDSLNAVAWYHAQRSDPDRGVPFAMRAIQLDPGCWTCFDTLAVFAHLDGQDRDAVALQLRAINLIPDFRAPPPRVFERLQTYQRAAAGQGGPK